MPFALQFLMYAVAVMVEMEHLSHCFFARLSLRTKEYRIRCVETERHAENAGVNNAEWVGVCNRTPDCGANRAAYVLHSHISRCGAASAV